MRDEIAGDLHEMFERRRATSAIGAWFWYWRQAVSFALHFLADRLRARRAVPRTAFSWIDLKLAIRMLLRYPGLTFVGVLGMSVGIAIAAATFTVIANMMNPLLPLAGGERIVAIQQWDVSTSNRELRSLHDFLVWREELQSLEQIGAFRTVGHNLIADGAQPDLVNVAEISATGFEVAGVPAALGRHLLPDDERAGAPDVLVISDAVWRRRFGADPGILGRQVQLGATTYAVVGVMPPGYAFPVDHQFWVPLRLPATAAPRSGAPLRVFGRLAPGATLESAQAEIAAIGARTSAALPATHEHLRPRVMPYTHAFTDMDDPDSALALQAIQTLIVLLLVLVCVNVAILVYARTATRQGEIAVRTALGASRLRIVSQLFLEALALASVAAICGVGLVAFGLTQLKTSIAQLGINLPFWIDLNISPSGVMFIVALTLLAAAIVGVIPALKATGRRVQTRLQGLSAGSGSRMQMGRLWTTLIVAQVAVAVAVLPATVYHAWTAFGHQVGNPGYAAHEFLTTVPVIERGDGLAPTNDGTRKFRARYAARLSELERALEQEAAVAAATFSLASPGGELAAVLEIEGMPLPPDPVNYNIVEGTKLGHLVRFNRVALDFLQTFDVPILTGRAVGPLDADGAANGVLVDRRLVDDLFGGQSPLGRRIRYVGRSREAGEGNVALNTWYEIVGVVPGFSTSTRNSDTTAGRVYHVVNPGDVYPATVAIRIRGARPSSFAPRLRELAAAIDPNLQLHDISSAEEVAKREQGLMRLVGITLTAVTLSVILLSGAGIYSLMAFTVARRRKEIGIRTALGADPARILASVFSRAAWQLGAGAALGVLGAIAIEGIIGAGMFEGKGVMVLPLVIAGTICVGLLAAMGPARRGLRILPTEALREE